MQLFENLPLDEEEQNFINNDDLNQTQMTNFDNELEEMELNWFENHKQSEIIESFMDFLKDEEEQDKIKT